MKLYAYCLSDEVTPRMIESVVGISGVRPRLVMCREMAAVVSEFDDERVAVTPENVRTHERVVRHVLTEVTPLPFRFGTVISEARILSYLDSQGESLKVQLARVRGCVEWSVKVIWNPETVNDRSQRSQKNQSDEATPALKGSGTAFLVAKRRELLGNDMQQKRAAEIAGWLSAALGDVVREAQVNLQTTGSLVLAASHLVERARLAEYRAALGRARAERNDLHFLTSGAWPPYSFTSAGS